MFSTQVISGTVGGAAVVSSTYISRERPDQFGMVSVRHSGSKIGAGFTGSIEGSIDNTNWFVIEPLKVTDAEYQNEVDANSPLNSWNKVVPLSPYMRIRLSGGSGNTFNAWISE
jgi:hypothetical protein